MEQNDSMLGISETRVLTVEDIRKRKTNIRRFPERFMFQLTKQEFDDWKSQIVISNIFSQEEIAAIKMGARRSPYAFTEQGVAQLSAVLHSEIAVSASVRIMEAFVVIKNRIAI